MADHLSDEEQLQLLKNWWKENGTTLVTIVLVALIAYFGSQWWKNNQQQQAEQAAGLYSELLEVVQVPQGQTLSDEQKSTANYLVEQLQKQYKGSLYAVNGSLFAAKLAVESNDLDAAEQALLWAVDNADSHMQRLVNLRLARVYAAAEKYDQALPLLAGKDGELHAFSSLNAELKGDILLAQGDVEGARSAYLRAQNAIGDQQNFRQRLLPIKIANLPVAGE